MQAKGLIQFFFGAMVLVSVYQLSFTWVANLEGKKAENYAESGIDQSLQGEARELAISDKKSEYFSQNSDKTIYNIGIAKYNYDDVKKRSLNLGLDLQGGLSVVLEVSKYDLIKQLASDPKNLKFIQALDAARVEDAKGNGDLIDLFAENYLKADPNAQLVALFSNSSNAEDLARTSSNAEVISWLHNAADEGVESTYTKLKERIDRFGVSQPYVTLQKSTGRIMVELPGIDNPKRARELLQSTANLQFWLVWSYGEIGGGINQANNILMAIEEGTDTATVSTPVLDSPAVVVADPVIDSPAIASDDTLLADDAAEDTPEETNGPLVDILTLAQDAGSPIIGTVLEADTLQLMKYLKTEEVLAQFPPNIIFMLSSKPNETTKAYDLYAVKSDPDSDQPLLDGAVVKSAAPDRDPMSGKIQISMSMKPDGARKWKDITTENVGKFIAITLDNKVYSAPRVNEPIPGGRSQISGDFTTEEAIDLSNILEVGKLPVPSRIVQEDIVGPSLGAESIRDGVISMIVGLILVIIFMGFYYARAGLIADLALFANIFFIFGV